MRPLSEADFSEVDVVVFDIDDTVTRGGRLEAIAFDAMWRLHDGGLSLIAVTGRPLGWADVAALHWPLAIAVGENGAGWSWLEGGVVREGYHDREQDRARQRELIDRVRARVAREMPDVRLAFDQRARRCDLSFDIGEAAKLPPESIDRLVLAIEAEGARALVSSVHAHVVPGGWDKARGVRRAAMEVLGRDPTIEQARFLFVGDSANDADAFRFFERSVGVGNVREHLPRIPVPPRFVTTADRGRGFAEVADHLLAGRRLRGAPGED
jgi:HAD superfamily hydrolase (TIGR01484 family)